MKRGIGLLTEVRVRITQIAGEKTIPVRELEQKEGLDRTERAGSTYTSPLSGRTFAKASGL